MVTDWQIHELQDLPTDVWRYIRDKKFFGMIIPKRYGGLEFSATAQMSILVKIYGRSITAATTISVPNSLGPGELLLKYGTDEQKNYYKDLNTNPLHEMFQLQIDRLYYFLPNLHLMEYLILRLKNLNLNNHI